MKIGPSVAIGNKLRQAGAELCQAQDKLSKVVFPAKIILAKKSFGWKNIVYWGVESFFFENVFC